MKNTIPNKYNMIVAADMDWCIGNKGKLLDRFPEDMAFFKAITTHKAVIMGTKTQESLPCHYLPNRINIILSPSEMPEEAKQYENDNTRIWYINNIETIPLGINLFNYTQMNSSHKSNFDYITDGDVFVMGGGQVYRQFIENDLIGTIYLTQIEHQYHGDTFIPNLFDYGFKITEELSPSYINDNGIKYSIKVLRK